MNKKLIIGGVAVVATGGLGYLGYRAWKKIKERKKSDGPAAPGFIPPGPNTFPASLPPAKSSPNSRPIPGARPNSSTAASSSGFPLKKGSRGEQVKMLQKFLNHRFDSGLIVDGIWGNDTEKALKSASQPNEISQRAYTVMEFAMKNIGLAGQSNYNRII